MTRLLDLHEDAAVTFDSAFKDVSQPLNGRHPVAKKRSGMNTDWDRSHGHSINRCINQSVSSS